MFTCMDEANQARFEMTPENLSWFRDRPPYPFCHVGNIDLLRDWSLKLASELPEETEATCHSILKWLRGPNAEKFSDTISPPEQKLLRQSLTYRYEVLRDRYWQVPPARAYQTLIHHLSRSCVVRNKLRTWIALSRDRRRTVTDLLQEVIQDMLQRDRYLQEQVRWIGKCTTRPKLRNLLMLATLEEYCLRPVHNQPLLVRRCTTYLQRSQRSGMTNLPSQQYIRFVSEDMNVSESDHPVSLLDRMALAQCQLQAQAQEQQILREQVKQGFITYVEETLGETAACWLELHLQGFTQAEITHEIPLSRQAVYRLKEKIRYHAMQVFAPKEQPELVLSWLSLDSKEDRSADFCDRPKLTKELVALSR